MVKIMVAYSSDKNKLFLRKKFMILTKKYYKNVFLIKIWKKIIPKMDFKVRKIVFRKKNLKKIFYP